MPDTVDILLGRGTSLPVAALATAIQSDLERAGVRTRTVRRPPDSAAKTVTLVVAPHETLPALVEADGERLQRMLGRSLFLVLAHPSSPEWDVTLPFAQQAGGLLHVSDAGVAAFKRLGRRVRRFTLGYHETFDRRAGAETERTIDAVLVGAGTPRRLQALAEAAAVLSERDVTIHLPDSSSTLSGLVLDDVAPEEHGALLARALTSLHLQGADDTGFDWLGAVRAICNGSVVVADETPDTSPLRAGLHFVEAAPGNLGPTLATVLDDPDGIRRIRADAYRFLRDELPLQRSTAALAELAETLARESPRERRHRPPDPTVTPAPPPETSADPRFEELTALATKQNAVLKKLFLDLRLMRRQLARMQHALETPERPLTEVTRTRAVEQSTAPDVSVLISLHNYGRFVEDALVSALTSEDVVVEVIVVDDASTDSSVETVKTFMSRHEDEQLTLVEQRINTGVQRARNHAFTYVRAPYVFVLDADNVVYPRGLAKLRAALEADSVAGYAYGLLERFSRDQSVDLINTHSWDATRLADEHYIDAMALIRADGWRRVGGYVTEQSMELGWEDYDLWLSFAMAGMHGTYVREIVGRYRVHGVSSLTTTTLDVEHLRQQLQKRHAPFFAATSRGL